MLFNVVGLMIGIMILLGGIYYLVKDGKDEESKKIYGMTVIIGAMITVVMIIKWLLF